MIRLIGTILAGLLALSPPALAEDDATKLIFVLTWTNCELVCGSFVDAMEASGLDSRIEVREAGQDQSKLADMVQEVRDVRPDLILTMGTSVTLAVVGTLDDAGDDRFIDDIPVVFTFVAEPFGMGIAEGFDGSGRANVTGTYGRAPETVNLNVMRSYDPNFRRLGILYNHNEPNSVVKVDELRALSETEDFELIAIDIDPEADGAPDPALIPVRMAEIAQQDIDFMYLGSSSFLRTNAEVYTRSAVENGIAVLSPYENLVREYSALLSVATLETEPGQLAAGQALKILRDGAVPGDLPIARATDFAYVVNMSVARALDRYPPFEFMQFAEAVN
jgi:putative ABC transport system substrate-binding protein